MKTQKEIYERKDALVKEISEYQNMLYDYALRREKGGCIRKIDTLNRKIIARWREVEILEWVLG